MGEMILPVNDDGFADAVEKHPGVVLVDFWATWCGPCRMIAPMLDELAAELAGTVKFVKVNVDEATEAAMRFGIQSIPCLVLFKNGQEVDRHVGASSKQALREWLSKHVS